MTLNGQLASPSESVLNLHSLSITLLSTDRRWRDLQPVAQVLPGPERPHGVHEPAGVRDALLERGGQPVLVVQREQIPHEGLPLRRRPTRL